MRAGPIEELVVYQKALATAHEVPALLKRAGCQRGPRLRDQRGDSSASCPAKRD